MGGIMDGGLLFILVLNDLFNLNVKLSKSKLFSIFKYFLQKGFGGEFFAGVDAIFCPVGVLLFPADTTNRNS